MSPLKGCGLGALITLLILVFVVAGIALNASPEYNGDCISFEPPTPACSRGRFLIQAVALTIIAAPFTHSFVFFSLLFVLLGLPIAGFFIALIRSRARNTH